MPISQPLATTARSEADTPRAERPPAPVPAGLWPTFLDANARTLRRLQGSVDRVLCWAEPMAALDDHALRQQTAVFRARLASGASLDSLLPEAFAAVREATRRTLHVEHYACQIQAAVLMAQGKIAQMNTGEGKTLTAVLTAYLLALESKGVHVVTANDYLAHRDATTMAPIFAALGLTVGIIQETSSPSERHSAYAADVTFCTASQLGFDVLRDQRVLDVSARVLRGLHSVLVDEIDDVLIDQASTPLILADPIDVSDRAQVVEQAVATLRGCAHDSGDADADYLVDAIHHEVWLTDKGTAQVEHALALDNLFAPHHALWLAHTQQALAAHALYQRDDDYVVRDAKVLLIDANTGRATARSFSEGLHQALEAKEALAITPIHGTTAQITVQSLFKRFTRLAGMSGTAVDACVEFRKTYGLDTIVVPPRRPNVRKDLADWMGPTRHVRNQAVVEEVVRSRHDGRPILVGTTNICDSETLSALLAERGIPHQVLNAKNEHEEALLIANAGRLGMVTIATNMAGRGTDIRLGGDAHTSDREQVMSLGGLYVIGVGRNRSRRIDNQLAGRAARQGDPGSARFFLARDDELFERFTGADKLSSWARRHPGGQPVTPSGSISKLVAQAQAEHRDRDCHARQHFAKFDALLDAQSKAVCALRDDILSAGSSVVRNLADKRLDRIIELSQKEGAPIDLALLRREIRNRFGITLPHDSELHTPAEVRTAFRDLTADKISEADRERHVLLRVLDVCWQTFLTEVELVRDVVPLASYARQDPLIVFKQECSAMFADMLDDFEQRALQSIFQMPETQWPTPVEFPLARVAPSEFAPIDWERTLEPVIACTLNPRAATICLEAILATEPTPFDVEDVAALVVAAGAGRGEHGTLGLVTPVQAVRALRAKLDLLPYAAAQLKSQLSGCASLYERAVVLKTLGAHAHQSGQTAVHAATRVAQQIRGRGHAWLVRRTLIAGAEQDSHSAANQLTTDATTSGLMVPLLVAAENDPDLALDLTGGSGGTLARLMLDELGALAGHDSPHGWQKVLRPQRPSPRGVGALLDELYADQGVASRVFAHDAPALRQSLLTTLSAQIDAGLLGCCRTESGGYFLITAALPKGVTPWQLYDPRTGLSYWVKDKQLLGQEPLPTGERMLWVAGLQSAPPSAPPSATPPRWRTAIEAQVLELRARLRRAARVEDPEFVDTDTSSPGLFARFGTQAFKRALVACDMVLETTRIASAAAAPTGRAEQSPQNGDGREALSPEAREGQTQLGNG